MLNKTKSITIGVLLLTLISVGSVAAISENEFSDVPEDHWAYNAIEDGRKDGLWMGYGDGSFGMGDYITREEIAVLLKRNNEMLKREIMEQIQSENHMENESREVNLKDSEAQDSESEVKNKEGEENHENLEEDEDEHQSLEEQDKEGHDLEDDEDDDSSDEDDEVEDDSLDS